MLTLGVGELQKLYNIIALFLSYKDNHHFFINLYEKYCIELIKNSVQYATPCRELTQPFCCRTAGTRFVKYTSHQLNLLCTLRHTQAVLRLYL
jgi:hypothetical protein